ncbi:MAG: sigma 54-interacting transcriptional regulator [Bdellovibrionota bacterium]|nr:sigma 54-interacting transcriptional regulator [Bdellovibrionota bacterium]
MIEQQELTKRLDENGFQMGDEIRIAPVNARKKSFEINRTNFYFISRHFESEMLQGCFALLPEMRSERFKVKLSIKDVLTVNTCKKRRFYLEVQEGCAFKLNGSFHMGSFIEKGDILEIGYNQIFFDSGVKKENSKELIDERIIQSSLPLLLQGETGVGKSSMAKSIHKLSNRSGKFVQVNLSAISRNLIESELFGHVKGSFTGAHTDKCGVLKQADHGTLFLMK